MNTISLFFFSTPILSIICYHLIGNIWLPSIYRDWSRQTYYEAAGPTTKRSIAREILVAPMLLCIRSQQLIPVRLRFAIFTPPPFLTSSYPRLAWSHARQIRGAPTRWLRVKVPWITATYAAECATMLCRVNKFRAHSRAARRSLIDFMRVGRVREHVRRLIRC